jgi:hypothetical protein
VVPSARLVKSVVILAGPFKNRSVSMNEVSESQKQDEQGRQRILDLLRLVAREVVQRIAKGSDSSSAESPNDHRTKTGASEDGSNRTGPYVS